MSAGPAAAGADAGPAVQAAAERATRARRCRACGEDLVHSFIDLGVTPLCQTHIAPEQLDRMEPFYPLHARICAACLLVQLDEFVAPAEIFSEYAYFSSYSDSWVEHARRYCEEMRRRLDLSSKSLVVEIASNDGYLLQHFAADGIPVLGIEPAANVARAARKRGIRTEICFHGRDSAARIAARQGQADLLIGNNVLAHVPDLNDFVGGLRLLLKHDGVITMEFPHLHKLMVLNQFDTIYHEHFSYFSFMAAQRVFAAHGLAVFDVDELPTHGGSLRIHAGHAGAHAATPRVGALIDREREAGLDRLDSYRDFAVRVESTKRSILSLLIALKDQGKRIAGYGAPGKGNTLLNYCGLRTDFLEFTVDRNPYKQGKYTPGARIPILPPEHIRAARPDYIFILPWNLKDEIMQQLAYVRDWGARFIVPIPVPQVYD